MAKAAENLKWSERDEVLRRRFEEALASGLTQQQAMKFAESDSDIGRFRYMVRNGCPPRLIAKIVL